MAFENKPFTGVFWPREKKTERHPDFTGVYYDKVGDKMVEREISVWSRRSLKDGSPYHSFTIKDKFQPAQKSHAEASSEKPEPPFVDGPDDFKDLPF